MLDNFLRASAGGTRPFTPAWAVAGAVGFPAVYVAGHCLEFTARLDFCPACRKQRRPGIALETYVAVLYGFCRPGIIIAEPDLRHWSNLGDGRRLEVAS